MRKSNTKFIATRYECHLSNKSFESNKSNLNRHKHVQSGSTPFECEVTWDYMVIISMTKENKIRWSNMNWSANVVCTISMFAASHLVWKKGMWLNTCALILVKSHQHLINIQWSWVIWTEVFKFICCSINFLGIFDVDSMECINTAAVDVAMNVSIARNSLVLHFAQSKRHTTKHSGERPFRCEICVNRFTQKRTLTDPQQKTLIDRIRLRWS